MQTIFFLNSHSHWLSKFLVGETQLVNSAETSLSQAGHSNLRWNDSWEQQGTALQCWGGRSLPIHHSTEEFYPCQIIKKKKSKEKKELQLTVKALITSHLLWSLLEIFLRVLYPFSTSWLHASPPNFLLKIQFVQNCLIKHMLEDLCSRFPENF